MTSDQARNHCLPDALLPSSGLGYSYPQVVKLYKCICTVGITWSCLYFTCFAFKYFVDTCVHQLQETALSMYRILTLHNVCLLIDCPVCTARAICDILNIYGFKRLQMKDTTVTG